MTLRQCEVFLTYEQLPEESLGLAFFHGFMQDHTEVSGGVIAVVAVIEWESNSEAINLPHKKGQVAIVDPPQIRFLNVPTMFGDGGHEQ